MWRAKLAFLLGLAIPGKAATQFIFAFPRGGDSRSATVVSAAVHSYSLLHLKVGKRDVGTSLQRLQLMVIFPVWLV